MDENDKFIFIDRDGVINKDPGGWTEYSYVTRREDFYFLPGVLEALKKLTDSGYKVIFISNQQGVGKGYFSQSDLDGVTANFTKKIQEAGSNITRVYYCVHTKEENCPCRKPKPGLFYKAKEELKIKDFDGKCYIGDTERDIAAGLAVGLKTILVLTGKSEREDVEIWEHKPDFICTSLSEAVEVVLAG